MLFILTGNVQTGKTRWLMHLLERVEKIGVTPLGVTSPGIWEKKHENGQVAYEKLGIEAVLWPEQRKIPFALRKDLAKAAGSYKTTSQSAQEKLGWAIDDSAIETVNEHFDDIALRLDVGDPEKGLLVIDELGRLELHTEKGFSSALTLLKKGPTRLCNHALIVVRTSLIQHAYEQFASYWPSVTEIEANEEGENALLEQIINE